MWGNGAPGETPWTAMDYGPFLTASIEAPRPGTNIAYKGIALNVGRRQGSPRNEALIFDTDLLRYSVGWTGRFVALKGIVYDGEHWAYPRIDGDVVFANPIRPGWSATGDFSDPRPRPYGPLPRGQARWRGLYLNGTEVVLSFTVGDTAVLELPGMERIGSGSALTRTLELAPGAQPAVTQVAFEPGWAAEFLGLQNLQRDAGEKSASELLVVRRSPEGNGEVLATAVVGAVSKARWQVQAEGDIRLHFPARTETARAKILIWRGATSDLATFAAVVRQLSAPSSVADLTRGGPARWPQRLQTQGKLATDAAGPYAIDELPLPESNPWKSWMRMGGLDFFPDGQRAAVCTWNGDVWLVDGVSGDLSELRWQRLATGLFQPLGLKIVDGEIYVLGRDQITRLRDLNGDGETDFYENFNNDGEVSEHFHEFATDLKLGPDGDFYYIKCARHALPAVHAHHGSLVRVSRDGGRFEVIARGFRAVNGLGMGPGGEMTTIDNQGHWMPANRLNWVRAGGWYGNQWAWNPEARTEYDPPLCWMHNSVDRSGGTQLWVPTDGWGPLKGDLITISYGMGQMFLVLRQEVGSRMQGAVTRLPLEFDTGVMRGVFHPVDQQLYVCGLYGWAGNKTRAGGMYRIRHTGKPLNMARHLEVVSDGLVIGFTDPLDESVATDPGSYDLTAWNYRWSANYGSPDFRMDGSEGRDRWSIEGVTLSADRRRVFLSVPEMRPVMQWNLSFHLKAAGGESFRNFLHGSIHALGERSGSDALGPGATAAKAAVKHRLVRERSGLLQSLRRSEAGPVEDVRSVRLPALFVAKGSPVSAFVDAGPHWARWEGFLRMDVSGEVQFELAGAGSARLYVNHLAVLESHGTLDGQRSGPVSLRGGLNRIEFEYQSNADGASEVRLLWVSRRTPLEPVPATVLVHDAEDPRLSAWELRREGRESVATHQCLDCHAAPADPAKGGMPELHAGAPSLQGIGARLDPRWMARWILDPGSMRPNARMPSVLSGENRAQDAADLAAFLATRSEPDGGPNETSAGDPAVGSKLFADLGCRGCHAVPGEGAEAMRDRISLAHARSKWKPGGLEAFLKAPTRWHAATRMPDFKLSASQASALAAYLRSLEADPPPDRSPAGDAMRGSRLFGTAGCVQCHRTGETEVPALAAPRFEVLKGTALERGCLAESDADRGSAPSFAFTARQLTAMRTWLSEFGASTLGRDTPAEFAERSYRALRCQACHGRDSETDLLSQWSGMGGSASQEDEEGASTAGSVHVGRPALTHAGEKLYAAWMADFMAGRIPTKPRPDLQGVMPAFPAYAEVLAAGMAHQHGYGVEAAPRLEVNHDAAETGRRLTLVEGGFSCISCHGVGEQKALAGADTATVNFGVVAERLRRSYYWRYVQDPVRVAPGTMMPKFIGDDGKTALRHVFDGDPERQFDAIWHYLHRLRPVSATSAPRP